MTRKEMEFIIEKIKFHKYYLKEYCQLTDKEIREDKYLREERQMGNDIIKKLNDQIKKQRRK
jgi:hypothetical protein|tara:strand:- start:7080 stop:7265 length:186 start_codon:yes stop_codon:yes gene_type:complete